MKFEFDNIGSTLSTIHFVQLVRDRVNELSVARNVLSKLEWKQDGGNIFKNHKEAAYTINWTNYNMVVTRYETEQDCWGVPWENFALDVTLSIEQLKRDGGVDIQIRRLAKRMADEIIDKENAKFNKLLDQLVIDTEDVHIKRYMIREGLTSSNSEWFENKPITAILPCNHYKYELYAKFVRHLPNIKCIELSTLETSMIYFVDTSKLGYFYEYNPIYGFINEVETKYGKEYKFIVSEDDAMLVFNDNAVKILS